MPCCILVRRREMHGCIAYKVDISQASRILNHGDSIIGDKQVELVLISRPTAYGEYAPYTFVHSESEFFAAIQKMCEQC